MPLRKEMPDRLLLNAFCFILLESSSLYLIVFRFLFSSLHSLDANLCKIYFPL